MKRYIQFRLKVECYQNMQPGLLPPTIGPIREDLNTIDQGYNDIQNGPDQLGNAFVKSIDSYNNYN